MDPQNVYTSNRISFSLKKEEIPAIDCNMNNLEDIMPSEIGQLQKDKYSVPPLMELLRVVKNCEDRNFNDGCLG